jgi:hypothetical protein
MAAIDDAVRRTRDAIADYDQKVEFLKVAEIAHWSTPEKRGQARGERDVALLKIVGATEYLLTLIESERDTL